MDKILKCVIVLAVFVQKVFQMSDRNLAEFTDLAKKIIHKKRGYGHNPNATDACVATAVVDAMKRLQDSLEKVLRLCEEFERRGQLDYRALKDEVGVIFTVVLVFADDVGLTPMKLYLRLFRNSKQ